MAKEEAVKSGVVDGQVERRKNEPLTLDRAEHIFHAFEAASKDLEQTRGHVFSGVLEIMRKIKIPGYGSLNPLDFPVKFRGTDSVQTIMRLLTSSHSLISKYGPLPPGHARIPRLHDDLDDTRALVYADFAEILSLAGVAECDDDGDDCFFEGNLYELHFRNKEGEKQVVPAYCKGFTDGSQCGIDGKRISPEQPIFYFQSQYSVDPFYKIGKEYIRQDHDADVYWRLVGYTKTGNIVAKFVRREAISRPGFDEWAQRP